MRRDPLDFYRETISHEYVNGFLRASGICPRAGVFTATTVIWMMIAQRMKLNASLAQAVEDLRVRREIELLDLAATSGRARTRDFANRTSGYSQGRKRVPLRVVEEVADLLNETILSEQRKRKKRSSEIFVLDGSTLQIAHTPDNLLRYPQYRNQHGKAHYPLVRFCIATHADTGAILRPSYGPYNGPNAVSELMLAVELLSRLPKGATVLGDRYFGCFRFVHAAYGNDLDVLCRMKTQNAARVLGYSPEGIGEAKTTWTPSKAELKKYPELSGSSVRGKFVWCPLQENGKPKEMLILFTTTELSLEETVKMYGRRWLVETDLRDIKSTLKMNFIDAKSPEMIAKEIVLGACAYNMIRHMIELAATAAKLSARRFSFTAVLRRIHALAHTALHEDSLRPQFHDILRRALTDVKGLTLPIRAGPRRSEPRKIWGRGARHTMKKSREFERKRTPVRKKPVTKQMDAD